MGGVWGAWRAKPCAASRWSFAASKAHLRSAASAAQFAASRPPCASSRRPRCAAWPARPPSRATRKCLAWSARAASSAIQGSSFARHWARSLGMAGMDPRLSRWVEASEVAQRQKVPKGVSDLLRLSIRYSLAWPQSRAELGRDSEHVMLFVYQRGPHEHDGRAVALPESGWSRLLLHTW